MNSSRIRCAIIEDEAPARRRIKKLLAGDQRFEIIGEAESGKQALHLLATYDLDVLFLDIQLKDTTGFEVLNQLKSPFSGSIIFTTAYDQYAIKAFDAHAIDYLLKPFRNDRFYEALEIAVNHIQSKQQVELQQLVRYMTSAAAYIQVQEGKTVHRVLTSDLCFIKADGYYCALHYKDRVQTIRVYLKEMETLLPQNFVRINRSIIINKHMINWVRKLKRTLEVELSTGDLFQVKKDIDRLEKVLW